MQRRHRPLAFGVAVLKKFGEDRAGALAANIAYYCFFSVFPLLLVLVTVLGYLVGDDSALREEIAGSALAHVPVVGHELEDDSFAGHGAGLVVGLVGALWAGMGAINATQTAMNSVWDVPFHERPNFVWTRVRALVMLGILGVGLLSASVLNAIASAASSFDALGELGIAIGNIILNAAVIALAFRTLTDRPLSPRQVVPGAVVAGILYFGMQSFSTRLVAQRVESASDVYGTFAVVIGLLTYFHVLAQMTLLCAQINVVRDRRLYPRSVFGGTPTDADVRVQRGYALEAKHREALVVTRSESRTPLTRQ